MRAEGGIGEECKADQDEQREVFFSLLEPLPGGDILKAHKKRHKRHKGHGEKQKEKDNC
jgi:hypothetical protein